MRGSTWAAWRVFLKATYGLPLSDEEFSVFRRHTERESPPGAPVAEAWMVVGRAGGKSRVAGVAGVHAAITFDASHVAPGELVVIPLIASDRRQARQLIGYVRGLCALPAIRPVVHRIIKETVEFTTGANIEIMTASVAAVRGYTCPTAACDELAFWRTADDSANPDAEILTGLRPALARVPGALLLALSTPYAEQGELWRTFTESFGQDDPNTLVWCADTLSMHPATDDAKGRALVHSIERMWERDPRKAASEYGRDGRVTFRAQSAAAFLTPEALDGVTDPDVREREPEPGGEYTAFVDMSGGQSDSMALGIAHVEANGVAVLDLLRERKPPLNIAGTIEEWRPLLEEFGIVGVHGDRYAAQLTREAWGAAGFEYVESELTASALYVELLPALNTRRVRLLDDPTLRAQLLRLERRPRQGGKDTVTHPPHSHDDAANVAAGALVLALGVGQPEHQKALPPFMISRVRW